MKLKLILSFFFMAVFFIYNEYLPTSTNILIGTVVIFVILDCTDEIIENLKK